MILCDAGPLYALINADDAHHGECVGVLRDVTLPLVTTWPCFTEAMYLLGRDGGFPAQEELWSFLRAGFVALRESPPEEAQRMGALMRQYRDRPMDLADASLVAAAEALNDSRVFTTDRDFLVYRFRGRQLFDVVPELR